jgi:hypothetical protein
MVQGLVTIVKLLKKKILVRITVNCPQIFHYSINLCVKFVDRRGEEASQTKAVAFPIRKTHAFVIEGIVDNVDTMRLDFQGPCLDPLAMYRD